GVAHPARLFALACAQRADLLRLLKLLATGVELATLGPLRAAVAKVARACADDMHHGGNFDAQVYSHEALRRPWLWLWQGGGHLGNPLAARALDAQDAQLAKGLHGATPDGDLPHLPVLGHRDEQRVALDAPILVVPLADGLAQH